MATLYTRRSMLVLAGAVPLVAGELWDKKTFPQWDQDDILRILTDSPWAKTESKTIDFAQYVPTGNVTWKELGIPGSGPGPTIQSGSPVGGIGAPMSKNKVDMDINVRWSSALPIRQATVLTKHGADSLDTEEVRRALQRDEKFYVIEVSGLPAFVAHRGVEALQAELYRTVRLFVGKKPALKAEAVHVTTRGANLEITVRFPKTEPITLKDKQVKFWFDSEPLDFLRVFKLKSMVYDGRLEL